MSRVPFPSRRHELLLRAALSDGHEGLDALRAWSRTVPFDDLDATEQGLMPLVSITHGAGLDHPDSGRIRGLHKRTWLQNQQMIALASAVSMSLSTAGVRVLALGDLPLVLATGEVAARHIVVPEFLVEPAGRDATTSALRRSGWHVSEPDRSGPACPQALDVCNRAGDRLRVRWRAFDTRWDPTTDDDALWGRAAAAPAVGPGVLRLSAADALLRTILEGLTTNGDRVLWVADSALLLRAMGAEVVWDDFIDEAIRRRKVLLVLGAIEVLARFGVDVPTWVADRLAAVGATTAERLESAVRESRLHALLTIPQYVRCSRAEKRASTPWGLMAFVRDVHRIRGMRDAAARVYRLTRRPRAWP